MHFFVVLRCRKSILTISHFVYSVSNMVPMTQSIYAALVLPSSSLTCPHSTDALLITEQLVVRRKWVSTVTAIKSKRQVLGINCELEGLSIC